MTTCSRAAPSSSYAPTGTAPPTGCTGPSRPGWSRPCSPLSGSSEDAALLLVDAHQPALVVGVGWHPTLAALVDSGRSDMPSAFLTRLRLGDRFVDASAVSAVYRRPARTWPLWLLAVLLLAALAATVVARARRHAGRADWRQSVVDQVSAVLDR